MQSDGLSRSAEVGKVLIDEERTVVAVEAVLSDKVLDLVYPGRMVDQVLERSSRLVDLLEIETVGGAILVRVDVAVPFSGFQGWDVVEAGVEIGNLIGR